MRLSRFECPLSSCDWVHEVDGEVVDRMKAKTIAKLIGIKETFFLDQAQTEQAVATEKAVDEHLAGHSYKQYVLEIVALRAKLEEGAGLMVELMEETAKALGYPKK